MRSKRFIVALLFMLRFRFKCIKHTKASRSRTPKEGNSFLFGEQPTKRADGRSTERTKPNKNQWLENHGSYVLEFEAQKKVPTKKEEKWRLENYSRGPEHDEAASWAGWKSSRWNKKKEKYKKKTNERFVGKKEKKDINYSRKQEQQIPIKDDWQMPSCFKCLLRLVIVGGIRVRSFRRLW